LGRGAGEPPALPGNHPRNSKSGSIKIRLIRLIGLIGLIGLIRLIDSDGNQPEWLGLAASLHRLERQFEKLVDPRGEIAAKVFSRFSYHQLLFYSTFYSTFFGFYSTFSLFI
jgi:hypothetical protein